MSYVFFSMNMKDEGYGHCTLVYLILSCFEERLTQICSPDADFYSDCIIDSLFVAVPLQVEMHDDCPIDLSLNIQSCERHQMFYICTYKMTTNNSSPVIYLV